MTADFQHHKLRPFQQKVVAARESGDLIQLGSTISENAEQSAQLGRDLLAEGDYERGPDALRNAIALFDESIKVASQSEDWESQAFGLWQSGTVLWDLGHFEEGVSRLERSRDLFNLHDDARSAVVTQTLAQWDESSKPAERKADEDDNWSLHHTFGLLRELVRQPQAEAVQFDGVTLTIDATPVEIPTTPADLEVLILRIRLLAERLSVYRPLPDHLNLLWRTDLRKGSPVQTSRLRERVSEAVAEMGMAVDGPLESWKSRLSSRLVSGDIEFSFVDRFDEQHPPPVRDLFLEVGPVFIDWPTQVLTNPRWSQMESPFPDVAPLPIDQSWVELWLQPPSQPVAPVTGDRPWFSRSDDEWLAEPIDDLLARLRGLVVLIGSPGSGKTTTMKWIARRLIADDHCRFSLPILIPLREFALARRSQPGLPLMDWFLGQCGVNDSVQLEKWNSLLALLSDPPARQAQLRETVLVLLDGWDEVPVNDREEVRLEVETVARSFPTIITSRRSGFPDSLNPDAIYEIGDLSAGAGRQLIRRWFTAQSRSSQGDILVQHLESRPDLRRLAGNPFLLTLLCSLSLNQKSSESLRLPRSRTELYKLSIDAIRRHHDQRHSDAPLSPSRQQQVERFALWLMRDAPDAPRFIYHSDEVSDVCVDSTLQPKVLEPSRLVQQPYLDAQAGWQFMHTSFQEYLAARGLLAETQAEPAETAGNQNRLVCHAGWQEVLRFVAGLAPGSAADSFWAEMRSIAERPDRFGSIYLRLAYWLAECGVHDGGLELIGLDLRDTLWDLVEADPSKRRAFADALIELAPSEFVRRIKAALPSVGREKQASLCRLLQRVPAGYVSSELVTFIEQQNAALAAIATYSTRAMTVADLARLRETAADVSRRDDVRRKAVRALANAEDTESVPVLRTLLDQSQEPEWTRTVLKAIGDLGGAEAAGVLADFLATARSLSERDVCVRALGMARSPVARKCLIQELTCCDLDVPAAIELLKALDEVPLDADESRLVVQFLKQSTVAEIRAEAALALLASNWLATPAALRTAFVEDESELVQEAAMEALVPHANGVLAQLFAECAADRSRPMTQRCWAMRGLFRALDSERGRYGEDSLVMTVQDAFDHAISEGTDICQIAAAQAYKLGSTVNSPLLATALNAASNERLRVAAIESIVALGNASACDDLMSLVNQDDSTTPEYSERVAHAAATALTVLAPLRLLENNSPIAHAALEDWSLRTGCLVFDDYYIDASGRQTSALTAPSSVAQVDQSAESLLRFIQNWLTPDEFSTLCHDHFPDVYNKFTDSQPQSFRIRLLIDYCRHHERLGALLSQVRLINPKSDHDVTVE